MEQCIHGCVLEMRAGWGTIESVYKCVLCHHGGMCNRQISEYTTADVLRYLCSWVIRWVVVAGVLGDMRYQADLGMASNSRRAWD